MNLVRPATLADLPVIHRLQNVPYRDLVFAHPLPPLQEFLSEGEERIKTMKQVDYIFEQDAVPMGFIEYQTEQESTSIWGKWLSTLVYVCGVLAFDDLKFSKLVWHVRASNKPMLRTCEKMKFRRTGEKNFANITGGLAFVAFGKLTYFEITAAEFNTNRGWMKDLALPVEIRFRDPS